MLSPGWTVRLGWPTGDGCSSLVRLFFLPSRPVHQTDFVISEGLMTVGCAVVVFFFAADFPEEAKWLSDGERAFAKARLAEDVGDSQLDVRPTCRDVLGVFKDFKIFLGGFMYFGLIVSGYGYAFFAPTIIRSFGYSPVKTQLYSVPPWAVTFALSMVVAIASDYYKRRYIFILPLLLISVVGIIVLLNVHDKVKAMYGALFLVVMGQFSANPIVACWTMSNRESIKVSFQLRRLTCLFNSRRALEARRWCRLPDWFR